MAAARAQPQFDRRCLADVVRRGSLCARRGAGQCVPVLSRDHDGAGVAAGVRRRRQDAVRLDAGCLCAGAAGSFRVLLCVRLADPPDCAARAVADSLGAVGGVLLRRATGGAGERDCLARNARSRRFAAAAARRAPVLRAAVLRRAGAARAAPWPRTGRFSPRVGRRSGAAVVERCRHTTGDRDDTRPGAGAVAEARASSENAGGIRAWRHAVGVRDPAGGDAWPAGAVARLQFPRCGRRPVLVLRAVGPHHADPWPCRPAPYSQPCRSALGACAGGACGLRRLCCGAVFARKNLSGAGKRLCAAGRKRAWHRRAAADRRACGGGI